METYSRRNLFDDSDDDEKGIPSISLILLQKFILLVKKQKLRKRQMMPSHKVKMRKQLRMRLRRLHMMIPVKMRKKK